MADISLYSKSLSLSSDSEPEFDMDPKIEPFPLDSDYPDQNTFLTNLFDRSSQKDPTFGGQTSSEVDLELGLGLSQSSSDSRRFEGLRVVSLDSDSDSDEPDHRFRGVSDFDRPPFCWDYLGFNDQRNDRVNNELSEVDCNSHEIHDVDDGSGFFSRFHQVHNVVDDDGGGGELANMDDETDREVREVSLLFDTYQERAEQDIMIPSDTDDGGEFDVEEAIRDLEWEILLAVNNFNREVFDMDINVNMYDAILNEFEERMNDWRGSPPAANSVIENLPIVRLSSKSLEDDQIVCAICKDDISLEEEVRQLPCSHYYHGDCIFPWLKMHNTCPVCRHELPTDDLDYESKKRDGEEGMNTDADGSLNSQVGLDFHVFL